MALKKFLKNVEQLKVEHRRKHAPHPTQRHDDESNWLVSYADMMTLLCGFFIMLFSLSHIDEPKYEVAKESLAKTFGGKYTKPTEELKDLMTRTLEESGALQTAKVTADADGVQIAFESTYFFDTLSTDLKPEGRLTLLKVIQKLSEHQINILKEYPITIEGHTDARPITAGTFPSNWELSGSRAARVARLFVEQGFSPDKLAPIGYGDARPIAPSRLPSGDWDEAALAQNRRVVIRISRPNAPSTNVASAAAAQTVQPKP